MYSCLNPFMMFDNSAGGGAKTVARLRIRYGWAREGGREFSYIL